AEEVGQRRGQVALQRHGSAGHLDGLDGQGVVQLELAGAAFAEVGQGALEAEEGGDGEADGGRVVRVSGARGAGGGGADERHAQAIGAVVVGQPDDLVVGAEEEVPELLRLPGEAGVDDGQGGVPAVGGVQVELPAGVELAGVLGGGQAAGQPGVVQVA